MDRSVDEVDYERACHGDEQAVRSLVDRHTADLHRLARAMGLQASAAVDVVQIAWMKLFEHVRRVQSGERSPLRDPGSVKYWLTAVSSLRIARFR